MRDLGKELEIVRFNIIDMLNKSRDGVAYNLIDIGTHAGDHVLEKMRAIEGVINVRLIGDCD